MSSDLERTKEELPTGMPKTIVPSFVTWNGQCLVLSGSGVNSSHFLSHIDKPRGGRDDFRCKVALTVASGSPSRKISSRYANT